MKHFRLLGFIECASLLLLFLVAMPLKYFMGMPEAVQAVGSLHGALFLLYMGASVYMRQELGWTPAQVVGSWVIASVPLGPVLFDRRMFGRAAP